MLCVGVLAHVTSTIETLTKILEFLKPGGCCILQFTDQDQFISMFLNCISQMQSKFTSSYPYKLNLIFSKQLSKTVVDIGFLLEKEINYWTVLPGFGKLPISANQKILSFLNGKRHISNLGSEKIWMLRKLD